MTSTDTARSRPIPGSSALERLYARLRAEAAAARQKRREREGLRMMLELDEHILRDIGVTRGDVRYCSRLPHEVDASTALWRLSMRNRTRP